MESLFVTSRPALLVSVRNLREARESRAGGCDVLDVKEPDRGPLGQADWSTIRDIARFAADRNEQNTALPCSVALGELTEYATARDEEPLDGIWAVKLGPRNTDVSTWAQIWNESAPALRRQFGRSARRIAVAYADYKIADAPHPREIALAAAKAGCHGLLIDTCQKTGGNLFEQLSIADLQQIAAIARTSGLPLALAGSLRIECLSRVVDLQPQIVAVRGAACVGTDRRSTIARDQVAALRSELATLFGSHAMPAVESPSA
jgi:uncharacterized protein (UPF0264 family)